MVMNRHRHGDKRSGISTGVVEFVIYPISTRGFGAIRNFENLTRVVDLGFIIMLMMKKTPILSGIRQSIFLTFWDAALISTRRVRGKASFLGFQQINILHLADWNESGLASCG